jgi:hypothetical protein
MAHEVPTGYFHHLRKWNPSRLTATAGILQQKILEEIE